MERSVVGRPLVEVDTPFLVVDLPALDANIAAMAATILGNGVGWRPHIKAHKSPAIAHRLLAAGAMGITCAKLGEAEVLAANGIGDILIANQIVGPIKTRRLALLSRQVDIKVAVDSEVNVRELAEAARGFHTMIGVVIELDVGMERAGVAPGKATVALAKLVDSLPGLRFLGLMTWEGHTLGIADERQRHDEARAAVGKLVATAEACRAAGLPCQIVSCSGTGTYQVSSGIVGITDVEAGGGIFGDAHYRNLGVPTKPALYLQAQVTSRPTPTRIICDFGRKQVDPSLLPPVPRGINGVESIGQSIEHCTITLEQPSETPRIGDRVDFEIGYSDRCIHLHEYLVGVRDGIVETLWPVAARGKHQ